MKKMFLCRVLAISLLLVLAFQLHLSYGTPLPARPDIFSTNVSGHPPTIDGDASDWSGYTPALELSPSDYPIHTYVYFLNDATYLYVLVDAVGDTTDGPGCDEVLLEFNSFPTTDFEVGTPGSGIETNPNPLPAGSQVAVGFGSSVKSATAHRFYEMRIPRSYIGAGTGAVVDFSSPLAKVICAPSGSLPYDGTNGGGSYDNVYPFWLNQSDIDTYAKLHFDDPAAIPTLSEWGMIIFIVIAGLGSIFFLRKSRKEGRSQGRS